MNVEGIRDHIGEFVKRYHNELYALSQNESKALELAGTIAVAEHYRYLGYDIRIENPESSPKTFVVKTSTRGFPWNFSKIRAEKDEEKLEIHSNLSVKGFHDDGIYCVDIGVIRENSIKPDRKKWLRVDNDALITFGEVKKLVIYPMLLAQFIGIVHEIAPCFLADDPAGRKSEVPPILISLGNFSGNSKSIVGAYKGRKVKVYIANNFDIRLANYRAKKVSTPFYFEKEDRDEVTTS